MGTFLELFRVLDGWDTEELPERIDIRADETLAEVRKLRDGGRAADARRLIESEIRRLRPMVRSVRLHAVQLIQEEGHPKFRLPEYMARLHWLASQTLLPEREWEQARYHLVRAVELTPDDPTPRYSLVEVYEGTGDHASGWSLLKRTLAPGPDRFGPLFQFASGVRRHGARETAVSCFREIRDQDEIGIFRELSELRLAAIDRPDPGYDEREALWQKGRELAVAGRYDSAVRVMTELLSCDVTHGRTWAALGSLHEALHEEHHRDAAGFPVPFEVASAERQDSLRRAAQAYRMALAHGSPSAEVHHRLANTYLDMGFAGQALEHARRAAELGAPR